MTALLTISALASAIAAAFIGLLARTLRAERDAARKRATLAETALEQARVQTEHERARCNAERARADAAIDRHVLLVTELRNVATSAPPEDRLQRLDAALARLR